MKFEIKIVSYVSRKIMLTAGSIAKEIYLGTEKFIYVPRNFLGRLFIWKGLGAFSPKINATLTPSPSWLFLININETMPLKAIGEATCTY